MKLIPYESFQIHTEFDREAIRNMILNSTEHQRIFNSPSHFFKGEVNYSEFKLMKVIHYSNSFNPVIIGNIFETDTGSVIDIVFRLHLAVAIFLSIWFGGVILASLFVLLMYIWSGFQSFAPETLIPFGMLLAGWVMTIGGFNFEVKKCKFKFQELLCGK